MSDTTPPVAPVIFDNRLKQRRIDVATALGTRRFRRLLWVVGAAVVALIAVVVVDSALLDIDEVTVSGSPHADADALLAGAGVERGDALITLDLGAVERRLEAMPWVDTASVERSLPGSLSISITERVPTTMITAGESAALIDGSGRVLATGDITTMTSEFASYAAPGSTAVAVRAESIDTLVAGSDVSGDLAVAAELATAAADEVAGTVAAVVLGDDHLSLELTNGATVTLGDAVDLDHKIEALRVMATGVDLECLATLDLRIPTRPVLTRDVPCS